MNEFELEYYLRLSSLNLIPALLPLTTILKIRDHSISHIPSDLLEDWYTLLQHLFTLTSTTMGDGQTVNGQAITIVVVSLILSVIAILSVILRFLARRHKGAEYYLDDYLIVFGLVSPACSKGTE